MTSTNGAGPQPFNLNAAHQAARAEATEAAFEFTFGTDETPMAVRPMLEWPLEVSERLTDGDLAGALRLLLSPADYDRFVAAAPTLGDLNLLFEAIGAWSGVGGLGNSARLPQPASTPT